MVLKMASIEMGRVLTKTQETHEFKLLRNELSLSCVFLKLTS